MQIELSKSRPGKPTFAAAQLVSACFEARTQAHLLHLQGWANSHSAHLALEEFYKDIVGVTDTYAEAYQSRNVVIERFPEVSYRGISNPLEMLTGARDTVDSLRAGAGDTPDLQADIDNILSVFNSAIFKLTRFK